MKKQGIKLTPIGGVGQIGSNCTLIQTKGCNILIDSGILFPFEDAFDINYLIPDLSVITHPIDAIIITHGHEDHIGAIKHYIDAFPSAKIHAPLFAKKLIESKLEYLKISKKINLLTDVLKFPEFNITNFHVNHSIPNTRGLLITSKMYDTAILFISDFKIDMTEAYDKAFDFETIKQAASQYTQRIALLDSTNILSQNLSTPSEKSLIKDLKRTMKETTGNVFITTFASNIYRVQTILNIGKELNRAVIPYGRAMKKYIAIATETDFLEDHGIIKEVDDQSVKKQKIIITSGSQGEFRGTTRRVITKQDSRLKLKEGDTYIFSSKAIPGNEKKISLLYNEIIEQGCKLVTQGQFHVHVSGHPGLEDLRLVYDAFKPTHSFPIHGESLFLEQHVDFILKEKLSTHAQMILNGYSIFIGRDSVEAKEGEIKAPILIHGNGIEIQREKISERRKIATQGAVLVSFSKESINKFKPTCTVTTIGLPLSIDEEIETFKSIVVDLIKESKNKPIDQKVEKVRVATRRFFGERLGYRPVAVVHIC